jgi:hypothetical protein
MTAGNDQAFFYKGTFRVGAVRVPSLSMYVSGGPPGAGTPRRARLRTTARRDVDLPRPWRGHHAGRRAATPGRVARARLVGLHPLGRGDPPPYTSLMTNERHSALCLQPCRLNSAGSP